MIKNKRLRVFLYLLPFWYLVIWITMARIGPFVSQQEAAVAERLYQFAISERGSIAAAELIDGNWDKICIIDGLSGFDPIHFLNPPPKNIWWHKNFYWDWTGMNSDMRGLVLISPSGEMLVVKVDTYALDGLSLNFGSKIGCYNYPATVAKVP
jgi:hypothetical protein